jgi:mannose-6-phosphate isomerase-like protein (cupin superfamily)
MAESSRSCVIPLADARARVPGPAGEHFATVLQRGTVRLLLSQPVNPNRQAPHAQDELYVLVRGRGVLFHDGKRDAFAAGDVTFVAAGVDHRFEDFTEDLSVWVIFYGPPGGEA